MKDRLPRERKTIRVMINLFCRDNHADRGKAPAALCDECRELLGYAMKRIERCSYGEEKPTCANCPIHCYKLDRREQVRSVMRYAGPRMIRRHPVLAIRHLIDGKTNHGPPRPSKRKT